MDVVAHRPELLAGLRRVFAEDLALRLPRLVAACESGGTAWDDDVRRDVHTLGTSTWIIGESDLSLLARDLEKRAATGPAPSMDELVAALSRWRQ